MNDERWQLSYTHNEYNPSAVTVNIHSRPQQKSVHAQRYKSCPDEACHMIHWVRGNANRWQCFCLFDGLSDPRRSVEMKTRSLSRSGGKRKKTTTKKTLTFLRFVWSSASEHFNFVLVRQLQRDIVFVIPVVDARVTERSGQIVLLPVVVPVSVLVRAESKHADLRQTGEQKHVVRSPAAAQGEGRARSRSPRWSSVRSGARLTSSHMWTASIKLRKPVEGYRPWPSSQVSKTYLKNVGL